MTDKKYKGGDYYYKSKEERFIFLMIGCLYLKENKSGSYAWQIRYTKDNGKKTSKNFYVTPEKGFYKTKREAYKFLLKEDKKYYKKQGWTFNKKRWKGSDYAEPQEIPVLKKIKLGRPTGTTIIGRNKAILISNGKTYSTEVYSDYDEGVCHHNHNLRTCFMCNDIKDLTPDKI